MSPLWSPAFWLQTAVQSFCSLFSKHKGLSGYRPQCPRMFAENDLHAGSASPHRWSSCSPSPSSSHLLQLPFFPCCPLCGASTFHTIKKSVLFFFFSCPPCFKSEWERTLSRRRLLAARLQNSQMRKKDLFFSCQVLEVLIAYCYEKESCAQRATLFPGF